MRASQHYYDQGSMISRQIREAVEKMNYLIDELGELLHEDLLGIEHDISMMVSSGDYEFRENIVADLKIIKENAESIQRFTVVMIRDSQSMRDTISAIDIKCNELLRKI